MFIINHDQISAEVFDSEIVAIHFLKGTYFSLRGASLALWSWLYGPGFSRAPTKRRWYAYWRRVTPWIRPGAWKPSPRP
jgi:hypothetical protein